MAYETFAAVWPTITGNAYIDRINGLKKLVASTTLDEVAWNASLLKGDVAKELAKLKRENGAQIMKYGVTALDRVLLDNKLVRRVRPVDYTDPRRSGQKSFRRHRGRQARS